MPSQVNQPNEATTSVVGSPQAQIDRTAWDPNTNSQCVKLLNQFTNFSACTTVCFILVVVTAKFHEPKCLIPKPEVNEGMNK